MSVNKKKVKQAQKINILPEKVISPKEKAEKYTKDIQASISTKINDGDIQVNPTALHIQPKTKQPEKNLQISQKISLLDTQLKSLEQKISRQKEQQKIAHEEKARAAQELINRLKKQKQEHRNKIRFDQLASRLKMSSVSDDIINAMKQRKEAIVKERKRDMELKIFKNINRKVDREQENANNQVSYWRKIKQIQEKKRHHSTKILPTIKLNSHSNASLHVKKQGIYSSHKNLLVPRKNTEAYHKKTNSQMTKDYHDIVTKFLQKAKLRQESYSQRSPNRPRIDSKIVKLQFPQSDSNQENRSSQKQQSYFQSNLIDIKPMKSKLSNSKQKRKQLGDKYLKESLQKSIEHTKIIENQEEENQFVNLQAHKISLQPNNKIKKLQDKYKKILEKLKTRQLDKMQAIQMLVSLQRRLDKIDPANIESRLKDKLDAFEEYRRQDIIYQSPIEGSNKEQGNSRLTEEFKRNSSGEVDKIFEESSEQKI